MPVYGEFLQAVCKFTLTGHRPQVNVLNFELPTAGSFASAAAAIAAAIDGAWTAELLAAMSDQYTFDEIVLTDMRSALGGQIVHDVSSVGTAAGNALPAGVALCATLRTAVRGKSYRGRCYIGGWTEADNEANATPSAAAGTAVVDYLHAIRDDASAAGFDLSVVSRFSGVDGSGNPIPRASAIVTSVLNVQADDTWDRQKRRGLAP